MNLLRFFPQNLRGIQQAITSSRPCGCHSLAAGLVLMAAPLMAIELGVDDFPISDAGAPGSASFDAFDADVAYSTTSNRYLVVFETDDPEEGVVDNEYEIRGQFIDGTASLSGTPEIGNNDFRISVQGGTGDGGADAVNPAVAWNSTTDQFLVVWQGHVFSGGDREIYGQIVDSSGTLVGGSFRISSMGTEGVTSYVALDPDVAYNATDNTWLVVWEGDDDTLGDNLLEIWGQLIDANGQEIGSDDIRLTERSSSSPTFDANNPAVSWNATDNRFLVVYHADASTVGDEVAMGRLLGNTGVPAGPEFSISTDDADDDTDPAVAWNGTDNSFLVVWDGKRPDSGGGEDEIYGSILDGSGNVIAAPFQIGFQDPADNNIDAINPEVAWGSADNEWVVTWMGDTANAGEEETWIREVSNTGTMPSPQTRISTMGDTTSTYQAKNPEIAYNVRFDEFLVVWHGDDDAPPNGSGQDEIWGQIWGDALPVDLDEDGWAAQVECNDNNDNVFPGNTEVPDLVDNNCDGIIDEGFDADGDGIDGTLEYAFGLDAAVSDYQQLIVTDATTFTPGLPDIVVQPTPGGFEFKVRYVSRTNGSVSYTVQFSEDLLDWDDGTAVPQVISSNGGELEVVEESHPYPAGALKLFCRVRATLN